MNSKLYDRDLFVIGYYKSLIGLVPIVPNLVWSRFVWLVDKWITQNGL